MVGRQRAAKVEFTKIHSSWTNTERIQIHTGEPLVPYQLSRVQWKSFDGGGGLPALWLSDRRAAQDQQWAAVLCLLVASHHALPKLRPGQLRAALGIHFCRTWPGR
jgi:hypothetical protein